MILINLTHLNASNGMFWYALDKIKSLGETDAYVVFVRPELVALIRRELPAATVHASSRLQALRRILRDKIFGRPGTCLVTFTPHPIPFVNRQTIAFYDDYPFRGWRGMIKLALFVLGTRTSRSRVGIINRSVAVPFLEKCGITAPKVFFDSAFPAIDPKDVAARPPVPDSPLRIGLVGTDSRKKNYEAIFTAAGTLGVERELHFVLYGAENDYTRELTERFPGINLTVAHSDNVGMPSFFGMIDYLISASRDEGYGRPMGLAAALGVPMFLLRSPVFLEFFADHATFFDDLPGLLTHIVENRPPATTSSREFFVEVPRSPFFD